MVSHLNTQPTNGGVKSVCFSKYSNDPKELSFLRHQVINSI